MFSVESRFDVTLSCPSSFVRSCHSSKDYFFIIALASLRLYPVVFRSYNVALSIAVNLLAELCESSETVWEAQATLRASHRWTASGKFSVSWYTLIFQLHINELNGPRILSFFGTRADCVLHNSWGTRYGLASFCARSL